MGLKFGRQAELSEGSATRQPGTLAQQAIEFLKRIPTGLPETVRNEIVCTRQLKDAVTALGEKDRLSFEQDGMTWLEVKPGSASRSEEFIILRTEGQLRKVVGQYVRPEISDGKRVTTLTDMSPEQTRELVGGLHSYAHGSARSDHDGSREPQPITAEIASESAIGPDASRPLVAEEVIKEAERILQEAWESSRQNQAKTDERGYRQVPDLSDFFNDPQVILHANFGQLI